MKTTTLWNATVRLCAAIALATCWGCANAGTPGAADAEAAKVTFAWRGDTCIYQAGEWELRISYLYRGTRSEGQQGGLYKGDQEVAPDKEGEELETPFGKLKHYGMQRKQHWDITGWNFADRAKVKPSNLVGQAKSAEGAAATPSAPAQ
jgi:hypothetical protein